jgi:hypothetical protein
VNVEVAAQCEETWKARCKADSVLEKIHIEKLFFQDSFSLMKESILLISSRETPLNLR